MFDSYGKNVYTVLRVNGGNNDRGGYTFLTLDNFDEKNNRHERQEVKVWGANLSDKISKGDLVCIKGNVEYGIVARKDKNDATKVYYNLTTVCSASAIELVSRPEPTFEPDNTNDNLNLPF